MAVKLFVGGLSFSTSNERLREVFAAPGKYSPRDAATSRCMAPLAASRHVQNQAQRIPAGRFRRTRAT